MRNRNNCSSLPSCLRNNLTNPAYFKSILRAYVFVMLLIFIHINGAFSQNKRVVAIGSSTAAGTGASSVDSCWVSLLNNYYKCRLGIADSVYNLGIPGADNYRGMPTNYAPPATRPLPDPDHNVSKAGFLLKDIPVANNGAVIVNYPTNRYNIYSIDEIMSSLQLIYDSAIINGNRCFIATTQPRTDGAFNTSEVKRKLADIKDSIINRFGTAHTINFWDGMYDPADSSILDKYSFGDLIHFNNAGHRELFERVVAKNIFNLPVWYSKSTGTLNNLSTWGSNTNGSGNNPTSFTADYQVFNIVNNPSPTITANWTISGNNSRLIIGDGITPINFITPAAFKVTLSNPPINSCY